MGTKVWMSFSAQMLPDRHLATGAWGTTNASAPLILLSPTSCQRLTRRYLQTKITAGIANKAGDPVFKTTIPFLNSIFLQLFKVTCRAEQPLYLKLYTAFDTAPIYLLFIWFLPHWCLIPDI
ncbi:hypothetical protein E2320_014460 [Naja naja]|nr:hypothetical protein E2320_014460 [Naja naja]